MFAGYSLPAELYNFGIFRIQIRILTLLQTQECAKTCFSIQPVQELALRLKRNPNCHADG